MSEVWTPVKWFWLPVCSHGAADPGGGRLRLGCMRCRRVRIKMLYRMSLSSSESEQRFGGDGGCIVEGVEEGVVVFGGKRVLTRMQGVVGFVK